PGPRSRELLEQQSQVVYGPMREDDEMPLVLGSKADWIRTDLGRHNADDPQSCWGSTPLGAHPAAVEAAVTEAQARYGMEITDYVTSEPVISLAKRLGGIPPPPLAP